MWDWIGIVDKNVVNREVRGSPKVFFNEVQDCFDTS